MKVLSLASRVHFPVFCGPILKDEEKPSGSNFPIFKALKEGCMMRRKLTPRKLTPGPRDIDPQYPISCNENGGVQNLLSTWSNIIRKLTSQLAHK